jgi:hypothetical protein
MRAHASNADRSGVAYCRKNVEFYEDKGLDPRFRSRLSDFKESGYDRGHMVIHFPTNGPGLLFMPAIPVIWCVFGSHSFGLMRENCPISQERS